MLKASYIRVETSHDKPLWTGVLRDDSGNVVWSCGHLHSCRDSNNSRIHRRDGAARKCAAAELRRRTADQ